MGYYAAFEQHKSGALPAEDWHLARVILRSFWLVEGKAKDEAWQKIYEGGFFPQDFLDEVEKLHVEARQYKAQLDDKGLKL